MKTSEARVLIADGDTSFANRVSRYLKDSGFNTKVVTASYVLPKTILEWQPHFLFIDLMFPGYFAQTCLNFLRERNLLGENGIYVVVMSHHNAEINVQNCLHAGADDFMVKPIQLIEILQRLALLAQTKKYNFNAITERHEQRFKNYFQMIHLMVQAVNQNKSIRPLRFELLQMVALALKAVRISIIETNDKRDSIQVINSSDDASLSSLPLDLKKYPELQYVLRTEKPIFIESVEKDKSLAFIKSQVKSIQFDSMMVLPLHHGSVLKGCLSIRMPKEVKKLSYYDIKNAEIAAQLIAITWKFQNAKGAIRAA